MSEEELDRLCKECRRMRDDLEMGEDGQIREACSECVVQRERKKHDPE